MIEETKPTPTSRGLNENGGLTIENIAIKVF